MKKNQNNIQEIKIDFNCPKEWLSMEKKGQNRNCQTCNRTVFDFSLLSNEEVLEFFKNRDDKRTCGRFEQTRLANLNRGLNNNSYLQKSINIIKPLVLAAAITSITACSSTQHTRKTSSEIPLSKIEIVKEATNLDSLNTILLQGKIVDIDGFPLIGAVLLIDGSKKGVQTDFSGSFELRLLKKEVKSETVTISYAGYESMKLILDDIKNKKINVIMEERENTILIGEVIIKESFHKRILNKSK